MFSLNLPTTQGYVYCCLFGIFKVANETENAGQSVLSGTRTWDQSLVCSEHYTWQQETRQPVQDKEAPYTLCQKSPSTLKLFFIYLVEVLKGKQRLS